MTEKAEPRRSAKTDPENDAAKADEPLPEEILARLPEPMRVWHVARQIAHGRLSFEEGLALLKRASGSLPAPSS